jgi:hypothetical protein
MQKTSQASPPEKKLAIIIRSHGIILTNESSPEDIADLNAAYDAMEAASTTKEKMDATANAKKVEQTVFFKKVNFINFSHFNIRSMANIGLAKLGNTCIGTSDIVSLIRSAGTYYASDMDKRKKTIEEKIQELFLNNRPPSELQTVKHNFCGVNGGRCDFELKQIELPSHYIEKQYTEYDKNSGVFVLFHSGFSADELKEIRDLLKEVSELLKGGVTKSYILSKLTKFNISKLFFCDFTCNRYFGLDEQDSFILSNHLQNQGLRGGKTKKRKTKKNKTKKNKTNKKNK